MHSPSIQIPDKAHLAHVPFFDGHDGCDFIFVDRSNPEKARQSIDAAAAAIAGGRSIAVFPEEPGPQMVTYYRLRKVGLFLRHIYTSDRFT